MFVLIGRVSYRCEFPEGKKHPEPLRSARYFVVLSEDAGSEDQTTAHPEDTFFRTGTMLSVAYDGEKHPTTGEPCFKLISSSDMVDDDQE